VLPFRAVIFKQSYSKVGFCVGLTVGYMVGSCDVGRIVGLGEGIEDGKGDGAGVGVRDGLGLGEGVGTTEGPGLGDRVGKRLGSCVGASLSNWRHVSNSRDISTMKGN